MGETHSRDPVAEYLLNQQKARGLAAFVEGMRVPWEGYVYMRAHRKLWRFGILPLVLNGILTTVAFAGFVYGGWQLYLWAVAGLSNVWWATALKVLLGLGVGALVVGAGIATALALSVIFCSYFYVKLARAVERQLGVSDSELHDVPFWRDLKDNLTGLAVLLVGNACLLALNLIPAVGAPLAGAGSWYFNAYQLGAEYLEYPWSIRGRTRRERRAFAKEFRLQTLGLGSVVVVFNLLPFVGGAVLTTAVTGSVFLRRRLNRLEK
jgi:uncharacterized protein involved in cysteine biosynthesis